MLLELRHPNLVLFMGAATLSHPTIIVSELCEGGPLFQLLHSQPDIKLSWPQRLKGAMDTAKGMTFLHRRRVVHRDLKSLNLLLVSKVSGRDEGLWVKISDFGLSRHLPSAGDAGQQGAAVSACSSMVAMPVNCNAAMMTSGLGTCLWMAPEVLSGSVFYDEKVDVYSYGIVLFELICRRVPFDGSGLVEPISVAIAVSAGRRPDVRHVPKDCPEEFCRTMEHCWNHEAAARPAFDVVLERLKVMQGARE
jgi:serine/threonine protein kinase